ncbi:MAG: hypothetical protein IJX18_02645 [Clostridia bacterium]|nr:hypothetical protein [Clostridia bacterium]
MTEDKMRRMVTGIVVGVTVLIMTLLAILIWQIVTICVQNDRIAALQAEQARLEQGIDEEEKNLAFYKSPAGKEVLAIQNDFIRVNGK